MARHWLRSLEAVVAVAWALSGLAPAQGAPSLTIIERQPQFLFSAAGPGANPGNAATLGGVATLPAYKAFLSANAGEWDFAPTDLGSWPASITLEELSLAAALHADSLVSVLAAGAAWQLTARLDQALPPGVRLELEAWSRASGSSRVTLQAGAAVVLLGGAADDVVGVRSHLWMSRTGFTGPAGLGDLKVFLEVRPR